MQPEITDTELGVLRLLWDRGTQTRRQLTDQLYPGGGPAHYATIQKLLERLETKGYVASQRKGSVRQFRATRRQEHVIRQRLNQLANQLCGGAVAPLLMTLVETGPISDDELRQLQALLRKQRSAAKQGPAR